eukprot:1188500-Lingulodinium_polyedra.AAC.1
MAPSQPSGTACRTRAHHDQRASKWLASGTTRQTWPSTSSGPRFLPCGSASNAMPSRTTYSTG